MISLGLTALELEPQFKSPRAMHDELCRRGLTDPHPSARLKAVKFIRSLQKNMGPEILEQLPTLALRKPRN